MGRNDFFLSTIGEDWGLAREFGLGVEIADYCTAVNMDENFARTDEGLKAGLAGVRRRTFHGPFNELFPCAVDPQARELARRRYRQAIELAKNYGAERVIFHGGFHPWIYYPQWYVEQSAVFWREFLREDPGVDLVLENVLEPEPGMLLDIVREVDHPRLGLCLDVGHANVYSKVPVLNWLETWGPWIRQLHLHNNDGGWDTHNPLFEGSIPMEKVLAGIEERCPEAGITLELPQAELSLRWLRERGYI